MAPHARFSDRLRSLREQAGISQYRLAQLSGITKQSLSSLEQGKTQPSWETVQRLALALGTDCRDFMDPNLQTPDVPARGRGRPRKESPSKSAPGKQSPRKPRGKRDG
jgi:transcriptional regulator with XRE-family HTH domain